MALINNWDLKDENNAIYELKRDGEPEQIYMVSDLGASFATNGRTWTRAKSKGNLEAYRRLGVVPRRNSQGVFLFTPPHTFSFSVYSQECFNPHPLVCD